MLLNTTKERTALVLCDLQPDLLGSLQQRGESLLLSLRIPLEAAHKNDWRVIYSGLKFQPGYEGVSSNHKLYGALRKLNQKLGDKAVHWFMEGFEGSDIISSDPIVSPKEADMIVWRSEHIPHELAALLKKEGITKVYIAGAKASGSVQISCQLLMDNGIEVTAIRECIQDDNDERLTATIDHLLPVYANVISLEEMMQTIGGLETYSSESRDILIHHILSKDENSSDCLLATDCGRRGHGSRYIQLLKEEGVGRHTPRKCGMRISFHNTTVQLQRRLLTFVTSRISAKLRCISRVGSIWMKRTKLSNLQGDLCPRHFA